MLVQPKPTPWKWVTQLLQKMQFSPFIRGDLTERQEQKVQQSPGLGLRMFTPASPPIPSRGLSVALATSPRTSSSERHALTKGSRKIRVILYAKSCLFGRDGMGVRVSGLDILIAYFHLGYPRSVSCTLKWWYTDSGGSAKTQIPEFGAEGSVAFQGNREKLGLH